MRRTRPCLRLQRRSAAPGAAAVNHRLSHAPLRSFDLPSRPLWRPEAVRLANYSDGGDLPDWGVAPTLCTARGRKLIQGQGTSLRAEVIARMGGLPIKAIYDAGSKRDNTTALDFLTGEGGLATTHRRGEPKSLLRPNRGAQK